MLIVDIVITLLLIDGFFMFNKERILLFPFIFSISQNFFQMIWKSFSVKSSDGKSSISLLSSALSGLLKFKLAKERDEIFEDCTGEKSCSASEFSMFSKSTAFSFIRSFISEVLIKGFFF